MKIWRRFRRWREGFWSRFWPGHLHFSFWRHWRHRWWARGGLSRYIPELPRFPIKHWWRRIIRQNYWPDRGMRHFLYGLPALAVLLFLPLAALVFPALRPPLQVHYLSTADRSLYRKDFETARVAYSRLIEMGSLSAQKDLFGLALSLRGLNKDEHSFTLLNAMASPDAPGYAPAHIYLAQTILASPNPPPAAIEVAQRHLQRALTVDPNDADANEMLGRIYVSQKNFAQAREHFRKAEPSRKEVGLLLADLAQQQGDEVEATRIADEVIKYYQPRAMKAEPEDTAPRLHWARATLIRKDYPTAINILDAGYRQSGKSGYRLLMGTVYAEWLKAVTKQNPNDWNKRFELLQQGLSCAPQNDELLRELIQLSHFEGTRGETARKAINGLLAQGKSAASLHFILGLDAWQRGQENLAQEHITLAYEMLPNAPMVVNNMAMLLCMGPEPDLPRALKLIQSVLEKIPNDPHFRDTRGQIYFQLKRWREAVADLEFALVQLPPTHRLHTNLAEAYQQLGMPELAAEHRRIADQFQDTFSERVAGQAPGSSPQQAVKK
jgi:tetratricopeptide (TPR) repeat protein